MRAYGKRVLSQSLTIRLFFLLPLLIIFGLIYPQFINLLFQNKYYRPVKESTDDEKRQIKDSWSDSAHQLHVPKEYHDDFTETLEYFSRFETNIIFDAEKSNPVYPSVYYILRQISLAQEAIKRLEQVTADEKKIAYYESNKNASLDTLIQHYLDKLDAKNEDKLSTRAAKNETRLRKYIVNLKKNDPLFINLYLALFTVYPIKDFERSNDEQDGLEFFEDLFEFFRIGHATPKQIHKSIAIEMYNIYKVHISDIDLPNKTTETELKRQIGRLIDLTMHTDSAYKNFNNIEQEPYIKNVVYDFPLFESDDRLGKRQIRRFKAYLVGKNIFIPKYIPRFLRKSVIDRFIKTPLSFYRVNAVITLFGLSQKKI